MDSVEKIAQNIKARFDHEAAKKTLREKYEAKMLFAAFGGMWRAGPELLNSITVGMPDSDDVIYLKDEYGNPCSVVGTELYRMAKERWQEQMNAWYLEYNQLRRER